MAEFKTITSLKDAEPSFEKADHDTLVIFDVDYVLTCPTHPAFHMKNIKKYKDVWKEIMEKLSPAEADILSTLVGIDGPSVLVEDQAGFLIEKLMKKEIKVIALTGILTGALGKIPDIEDWRYKTLKAFGIDFSQSFLGLQTFSFKKGILFSNGDASKHEKGKALVAFLRVLKEQKGWVPRRILFIDDREYNLQDLGEVCSALNPPIAFEGFLYQGAENVRFEGISEGSFRNKWEDLAQKAREIKSQF